MTIDKLNFVIPFVTDAGKEAQVFIPQPNDLELKGLAKFLGYYYSKVQREGILPNVAMTDYQVFIEDFLTTIPLDAKDAYQSKLDAFYERSLMGAHTYCDGMFLTKLSKDEEEAIKGSLTFISALYRYSPKGALKGELMDFFTSLSATEWKSSFSTSASASTAVATRAPSVVES